MTALVTTSHPSKALRGVEIHVEVLVDESRRSRSIEDGGLERRSLQEMNSVSSSMHALIS